MATKTEPTVKMVKIKIPLTRTETEPVYVAVNGKAFMIKRGVEVEVPDYVVEVLQHKEEMLAVSIAYEAEAAANLSE